MTTVELFPQTTRFPRNSHDIRSEPRSIYHWSRTTHEFRARSNRMANVKVGFSSPRSGSKTPIGDSAADFCPPAVPALVRGARPSDEQRRRRRVRLVVGKRGTVPMRTELIVRFGYGSWVPGVTRDLLAIAGPDMLHLRTPVELRGERLITVGDFAVSAGQRVPFVLTYVPSHLPLPEPVDADVALRSTEEFWQSWASACRSPEQHAE